MPDATITVSYENNSLSTTPTTFTGVAGTVYNITWAPGTGVNSINAISTPTAPSGTLTPILQGTLFSVVNTLGTTPVTYTYTITFNNTITQDPQIINNPNTTTP